MSQHFEQSLFIRISLLLPHGTPLENGEARRRGFRVSRALRTEPVAAKFLMSCHLTQRGGSKLEGRHLAQFAGGVSDLPPDHLRQPTLRRLARVENKRSSS